MMLLYDSAHKQLRLGVEIAQGGEAVIYEVQGRPSALAKIYTPMPAPGYEGKLAWMWNNPAADPTRAEGHPSLAWPDDLLYDENGRFVGYLMPRIRNAVLMLEVFNPRLREQTLPGFNRVYLQRAARNLSIALGALHARDYVVGDLNESNVLVTPAALITLIDNDSFQVQEHGQAQIVVYPCPVGKPEYTPPELQGKDFRDVLRRPEHDCFALGVLIFQLLMEGNHPYRCRWLGEGEPPTIEEKISNGSFPYVRSRHSVTSLPPDAPSLRELHPLLAELVLQCFVAGYRNPAQRPSPGDWEHALEQAEQALVTCGKGHYFSSHLRNCPRCGAGRLIGSISAVAPMALSHDRRKTHDTGTGVSGTPPRRIRYLWTALLALALVCGVTAAWRVFHPESTMRDEPSSTQVLAVHGPRVTPAPGASPPARKTEPPTPRPVATPVGATPSVAPARTTVRPRPTVGQEKTPVPKPKVVHDPGGSPTKPPLPVTITADNAGRLAMRRTLTGYAAAVVKLLFGPRGAILGCRLADGNAQLWSLATGTPILTRPGTSIAFSPEGSLFALGEKGGAVHVWRMEGGGSPGKCRAIPGK